MCRAPQRERSRDKHPPPAPRFRERHECTVNSSELAVHARAVTDLAPVLNPYRKNPQVCPHCLGKKLNVWLVGALLRLKNA